MIVRNYTAASSIPCSEALPQRRSSWPRARPGWSSSPLSAPRGLWIAIFLGIYSALLALLPNPGYVLLAIAPLLVACVAWWTLAGAPDRWLMLFLCAAVVLPPLPIALGDSGPHPCLLIA